MSTFHISIIPYLHHSISPSFHVSIIPYFQQTENLSQIISHKLWQWQLSYPKIASYHRFWLWETFDHKHTYQIWTCVKSQQTKTAANYAVKSFNYSVSCRLFTPSPPTLVYSWHTKKDMISAETVQCWIVNCWILIDK